MQLSTNQNQTMSSVEFARLLGCRVNDANNRIERNSKKYKIEIPDPIEVKLRNGEYQKQYFLDMKTSLALLAFMRANIGLRIFDKVIQNSSQAMEVISALNNFEIPDSIPDMYVYYIQNTKSGCVKIGISKNPEARLKQLQVACDGELRLLGYKLAENRFSDESLEHKNNQEHHIRGEWFNSSAILNLGDI